MDRCGSSDNSLGMTVLAARSGGGTSAQQTRLASFGYLGFAIAAIALDWLLRRV
jgi:hypothetical protein